ncbi:MAG: S8 family serine peptidase, partial [Candidatus Peribacteraceae bacterium]|nr:S8 family serine peptidase [Candidatus Peribacteraceae bacterium]
MKQEKEHRFLGSDVVLQEVYDELFKKKPVSVICSIREKHSVKDVIDYLRKLKIKVSGKDVDHTDKYVFATLKREKEGQRIDREFSKLKDKGKMPVHYIWKDKLINPCINDSARTINAEPAKRIFGIGGEKINWAVLDSGIDSEHEWFRKGINCSVIERENFTKEDDMFADSHGTHVAGIIKKIAPEINLYDYKVLGKKGGSSSSIIKAMYHIRKRNLEKKKSFIHGVNMSIGGYVKADSFGCGWTPECQEADLLMRSGVVVCVAAGNDGYKNIATVRNGKLNIFPNYTNLSVTDPGNAEEVITVGSTHKKRPHSHGPSFFSSKGPTGDGRFKPDCLAPGEKIVSAKAGTEDETLILDGTSMATPHVSGVIALFLSLK